MLLYVWLHFDFKDYTLCVFYICFLESFVDVDIIITCAPVYVCFLVYWLLYWIGLDLEEI